MDENAVLLLRPCCWEAPSTLVEPSWRITAFSSMVSYLGWKIGGTILPFVALATLIVCSILIHAQLSPLASAARVTADMESIDKMVVARVVAIQMDILPATMDVVYLIPGTNLTQV